MLCTHLTFLLCTIWLFFNLNFHSSFSLYMLKSKYWFYQPSSSLIFSFAVSNFLLNLSVNVEFQFNSRIPTAVYQFFDDFFSPFFPLFLKHINNSSFQSLSDNSIIWINFGLFLLYGFFLLGLCHTVLYFGMQVIFS